MTLYVAVMMDKKSLNQRWACLVSENQDELIRAAIRWTTASGPYDNTQPQNIVVGELTHDVRPSAAWTLEALTDTKDAG